MPETASPRRRPPPHRRAARATGLLLGGLVLLALLLVIALWVIHRGSILPGISIEGVDVGGRDAAQARDALSDTVEAREGEPVVFTLDALDMTYELDPEDAGFAIEVGATLDQAQGIGRDDDLLADTWRHVESLWVTRDLTFVETLDDDALAEWVDELAEEVDREPSVGRVRADAETLEVRVSPPRDGLEVRKDEVVDLAEQQLTRAERDDLELPIETTDITVSRDDVEEVADQARRALEEPLTLTGAGTSVTFEPEQLAPLIGLRKRGPEDDLTVELHVRKREVRDLFSDDAERFRTAATSASFEVPREPPVTHDDKGTTSFSPVPAEVDISPSSDGTRFRLADAVAQVREMLRSGTREAELRLATVEPELSTAEAEAFDITRLIGTFTTYHACCAGRVDNIQRLADVVDGATVAPGEQFSINDISGERSCSKGFVPAGTIVNGELVDTCGGGVSQFGTTTFNAAFFAGVQLDAWKAHSYYIDRYPLGREATLSFPALDVKFTNDTGNGILVKTSHTSTSVTVSIYGNTDISQVRGVLGDTYNNTDHDTQYREEPSLPPGSSEVVQSGIDGFTVDVTRIIRGGPNAGSRGINTVYPGRPEIIERNSQ